MNTVPQRGVAGGILTRMAPQRHEPSLEPWRHFPLCAVLALLLFAASSMPAITRTPYPSAMNPGRMPWSGSWALPGKMFPFRTAHDAPSTRLRAGTTS